MMDADAWNHSCAIEQVEIDAMQTYAASWESEHFATSREMRRRNVMSGPTFTVAPTLTFTPAPGSPWRQIPDDEAPVTALPYPFDATRVAPEVPSARTLTLSRFTAINPTRLSKAFALKGDTLDKQPGGNLDRWPRRPGNDRPVRTGGTADHARPATCLVLWNQSGPAASA